MNHEAETGMLEFFRRQHGAFIRTVTADSGTEDMLPALLSQAYSSFEGNVEIQSEGQPQVDCHKGCAVCCTLRVVATAPEVLMAARYVRGADESLKEEGIDLRQRLAQADAQTRGLGEGERIALRKRCPYIEKGACAIYPVRPLACRGHASYDRRACAEAASGRREEIPFSVPHMTVRSLVQNAMQSALRDSGFSWGIYEFNHSLRIALEEDDSEQAWLAGEEVFAAAEVGGVDREEMAQTFDRIHARID